MLGIKRTGKGSANEFSSLPSSWAEASFLQRQQRVLGSLQPTYLVSLHKAVYFGFLIKIQKPHTLKMRRKKCGSQRGLVQRLDREEKRHGGGVGGG